MPILPRTDIAQKLNLSFSESYSIKYLRGKTFCYYLWNLNGGEAYDDLRLLVDLQKILDLLPTSHGMYLSRVHLWF